MRNFWNNLKFILFALALSWAILQQAWVKRAPQMASVPSPPVLRTVPSKARAPQRIVRPVLRKRGKPSKVPTSRRDCEPQLQSVDLSKKPPAYSRTSLSI